ncbi:Ribonuclease h domain, partial [Thalictrum thalictroides]
MANLLGLGAGRHQQFFFNGESSSRVVENMSSVAKSGVGKKVSFADKVKGDAQVEVNFNELPVPSMRGNIPSIKISQKAFERGISYCKFSLIGRLDFHNIKLEDVRRMAQSSWNPKGDWKIVPLGKGFFMIRLTCEEDFLQIWGGGPWKFGTQTLRLTKWDPEFDPDEQRSSQAMVWVKFPKLKQQFWDYEILMSMGKTLGAPIGIDKHTADREYGFFASILVEIDLAKPIPPQILVEVDGGKDFMQEVVVGKLPKFCEHCKSIGHFMSDCKVLKNIRDKEIIQAETNKEANNRRKGKKNRNKNKETEEGETTSNGKDVIEEENEGNEKSGEEAKSNEEEVIEED